MQYKNKIQTKGWRKVKLGEIVNIKMGQSPSSQFYNSRGEGLPFYQGITDFGSKYPNKSVYCTNPIKIAEKGEILFSVRAPVGEINIAIEKSCIGRGIAALSMKNNNNAFLYYLLKYNTQYFKNISGGTTYEAIGKDQILEIEIEIPEDPNEQKRIADILSAFDDKIEVNNKIIKTLETMAQEIFKEFFEKNSKFEEDNIKNAEEIFVFERGIEPGSKFYSEIKKEGYIAFYRVRDLDNQNRVDVYIPKEIANGKICRETDVLISLDATLGRVKIGCSGAYSSGIRKVYSKDGFIKNSFIYFWLKSHYVQNTILKHASGSTILHAGQSLKFLTFPFNKNLIEKIQFIIDPMFIKILKILKENQTLAAIRDLLLPKLMRGEIRI
jgi:type I restriction enzyme S subunit